jgi:hypothetical protein
VLKWQSLIRIANIKLYLNSLDLSFDSPGTYSPVLDVTKAPKVDPYHVQINCLHSALVIQKLFHPIVAQPSYQFVRFQRSQEKVYDEILRVVGSDPSKPVTVDHINQMKYLKAFVKETFRCAHFTGVDYVNQFLMYLIYGQDLIWSNLKFVIVTLFCFKVP